MSKVRERFAKGHMPRGVDKLRIASWQNAEQCQLGMRYSVFDPVAEIGERIYSIAQTVRHYNAKAN